MILKMPKDINFLIVDDFYSIRKAVKKSLDELGFYGEKTEAESFTRASEVLTVSLTTTKIDFIICDFEMPGGDGLTLLNFVRNSEQLRDLPFLMLSAVNDKARILAAINAGLSNYLLKPWENESLETKLNLCWDKHKTVT
jgi:two-component system chemotaxis response regulator CheY